MSFHHQIPPDSGYNRYPVYPQHHHHHQSRGGTTATTTTRVEAVPIMNEEFEQMSMMSSPTRSSRQNTRHSHHLTGTQANNFANAIGNLHMSPAQSPATGRRTARHSHHVGGSRPSEFSPSSGGGPKRTSDFVAAMPYADKLDDDGDSPPATTHAGVPRMASLYKLKSPNLLEDQRQDLGSQGFPNGLAAELGKTRSVYPVRFWILDNSGSMMANDGCSIRGSTSVQCTRWAELQETVNYHAQLAGILQATTIFRLLNDPGVRVGPQEFSIADQGKNFLEEISQIKKIMQHSKPYGSTPLTQHLIEIAQRIAVMEGKMRKKGLEAVVVIATDGLPTSPDGHTSEELNDEFILALQHLQTLPVWVVIRLCTDEEEVVNFYNRLDQVLELPIEVLDDFFAEAQEIHRHNKWLNYAMPLHRCREIGYQHRIFDMLDERPLNKDEVKEICESIFGAEHFEQAPNIHDDFNGFITLLNKILKHENPQFNPYTKKIQPWIDTKELKRHFSTGGFLKRMSLARNKH